MEELNNRNVIHEIYSEDKTRLGLAKRLPLHSLAALIKTILGEPQICYGIKVIFLIITQCFMRFLLLPAKYFYIVEILYLNCND